MSMTRDYKETIRARAQGDPAFKEALLKEAMNSKEFEKIISQEPATETNEHETENPD